MILIVSIIAFSSCTNSPSETADALSKEEIARRDSVKRAVMKFVLEEDEKKKAAKRGALLSIEAYNFSHDLIKEHLKAPSTASFPEPNEVKLLSLGDDRYYVDGYVDSQNDFGAMVRTEYECWIYYRQNETVKIENIDFK
ncbi:hypothetical protein [Ekhidna sp.]